MEDLTAQVTAEIEETHAVFEAWLRGEGSSLDRVKAAMVPEFTIVHPRGMVIDADTLFSGLDQARGTRQFRIRVEEVVLRWVRDDALMATYEEWHEHAEYSTWRLSTAIFDRDPSAPGGLRWRHVHETFIQPPPGWVVPELKG